MGTEHGRLRIRIYDSRAKRSEYRLGHLLRQRSDALGCEDETCPLRESLAAHAGLAAERLQISLPLDAAAGHRSFRSQHRLFWLPGYFQNVERRAELERH